MTELSGPPEPVVQGDETVKLAFTDDKGELQLTKVGTLECARCGTEHEMGVSNGEIPELHECKGCERQGPFNYVGDVTESDIKTALRANEMWHAPTNYDDTGFGDLWIDIRDFIYDHWDAGNDENADAIYAGLTAFALSTWFRENMTFLSHLMLMGKTTGGKTRLLNTLAHVSYRAVVSASTTPAVLFRMIDTYDVTFFVSEYHGMGSDVRRELDNIVRAGQKRNETVNRAEQTQSGYEPRTFNPFSHVAIATQYEPEDDIVNRCIRVPSSPPNRDMPPTHDEQRAENIRNRLIHARYRLLDSEEWQNAEEGAYSYMAERNITGRTREKLLSLITIARLWGRMEDIKPFVDIVVEQDRQAAADSEDARVVEAIRDAAHERVAETTVLTDGDPYSAVKIPYKAGEDSSQKGVADRYEDMTGIEKSGRWVGHVVKRLGLDKERTRDGTVISDPDLGPKLRKLCDDLNLEWNIEADTSQSEAIETLHQTVRELESNSENGHVGIEAVKRKLTDEIGDRDAEHLIDSALRQGELYEPEDGCLAST